MEFDVALTQALPVNVNVSTFGQMSLTFFK